MPLLNMNSNTIFELPIYPIGDLTMSNNQLDETIAADARLFRKWKADDSASVARFTPQNAPFLSYLSTLPPNSKPPRGRCTKLDDI